MQDESRPTGAPSHHLSRRVFIAALPLGLSACMGSGAGLSPVSRFANPAADPTYVSMYGPVPNEPFPLPAIDLRQVKPAFYRRQVRYDSPQPVGTIVVDPGERYLYLIQQDGMAMRYGIGVGREGFSWSGDAIIQRKAAWPSWHPPVEMQQRDPKTAIWANGMPGGLTNPLGARALYLYQDGRDTLYRIHGTNEPWTIGSNVSSGCIRLINQDALDLYDRVPTGTRVVVLPAGGAAPSFDPIEVIGGLV